MFWMFHDHHQCFTAQVSICRVIGIKSTCPLYVLSQVYNCSTHQVSLNDLDSNTTEVSFWTSPYLLLMSSMPHSKTSTVQMVSKINRDHQWQHLDQNHFRIFIPPKSYTCCGLQYSNTIGTYIYTSTVHPVFKYYMDSQKTLRKYPVMCISPCQLRSLQYSYGKSIQIRYSEQVWASLCTAEGHVALLPPSDRGGHGDVELFSLLAGPLQPWAKIQVKTVSNKRYCLN